MTSVDKNIHVFFLKNMQKCSFKYFHKKQKFAFYFHSSPNVVFDTVLFVDIHISVKNTKKITLFFEGKELTTTTTFKTFHYFPIKFF